MKQYTELLALNTVARNKELNKLANLGDKLEAQKTEAQRICAKLLVAMETKGEIQKGEFKEHAEAITGRDIRKAFQDVYGLVNVFREVVHETIELTEAEFDTMDTSKLALLSTFLGDKHRDLLPEAIEKAKNGTAKELRNLKPKSGKGGGDKPAPEEKPKEVEIEVGFVVTDIKPGAPLVDSQQFRDRLKADIMRAADTKDMALADDMMDLFGRVYMAACKVAGKDPLDLIAELSAKSAKPANATVVTGETREAIAA